LDFSRLDQVLSPWLAIAIFAPCLKGCAGVHPNRKIVEGIHHV
jgi:hypothetical protein